MLVLIVVTSILFGMNPEKVIFVDGYPRTSVNSPYQSPDISPEGEGLTVVKGAESSSDLRAGQLTQTAPHATDTSVEQGK